MVGKVNGSQKRHPSRSERDYGGTGRAGAVQDAGAFAKRLVICGDAGGCARKVPAAQAESVAARQIPPTGALPGRQELPGLFLVCILDVDKLRRRG